MEMDRQSELVESLKRFCASTRLPPTPLLLFPEEEATNGREGLLRFRWVSTDEGLEGDKLEGLRVFPTLLGLYTLHPQFIPSLVSSP